MLNGDLFSVLKFIKKWKKAYMYPSPPFHTHNQKKKKFINNNGYKKTQLLTYQPAVTQNRRARVAWGSSQAFLQRTAAQDLRRYSTRHVTLRKLNISITVKPRTHTHTHTHTHTRTHSRTPTHARMHARMHARTDARTQASNQTYTKISK